MSMRRLLLAFTLTLALTAPAAAALTCNGSSALCSRPLQPRRAARDAQLDVGGVAGLPDPQPAGRHPRSAEGRRSVASSSTRTTGAAWPTARLRPTTTARERTGARGPYLCHVVCQIGATPLVPVLRSMRSFLRKHPGNVLLLDVEDYVLPKDFVAAMKRSGLREVRLSRHDRAEVADAAHDDQAPPAGRRARRASRGRRAVAAPRLLRDRPGDRLLVGSARRSSPTRRTGSRAALPTAGAPSARCS